MKKFNEKLENANKNIKEKEIKIFELLRKKRERKSKRHISKSKRHIMEDSLYQRAKLFKTFLKKF